MLKKIFNNLVDKKAWDTQTSRVKLSVLSGTIGIMCNILLCVLKFTIGTITNSVAITADAVNNLSDAGSSIVAIVGTKLSSKPIDKEHPFGHGRLEYISALVVAFFIFLMSFELGKSSLEKIIHPADIKYNIWSVVILICAILVKLFMARYNGILFKMTDNINLKAVRQDSLNDCIATGATMLALLISALTPFKHTDGIIGMIVAVVILISGIDIVKDITGKLLGQAPDEELVNSIISYMLAEEQIIGVHDLIVHDYGVNRIIASAHAEVPANADIMEIHEIIDSVEKKITEELKISICIHMDPIVVDDEVTDRYKQFIAETLAQVNKEYTFHDFRMVDGSNNVNLIFDLVVPFDKTKSSADILKELNEKVKGYDKNINLVVTIEHSMI